jgi:hypothetical protein
MNVRKVTAAGYHRDHDSMGTLVDEGHMEKSYYHPCRSDPDSRTIVWTLSLDAPFCVDNGMDPIIQPGQSVEWPS